MVIGSLKMGPKIIVFVAFLVQVAVAHGSTPVCYGDRATLPNGFYERTGGSQVLEIRAKCYRGYELEGDSIRYCDQELRRFSGTSASCNDIDECEILSEGSGDGGWPDDMEPCHEDATCLNTQGSYSCKCKHGYYGNGHTCQEVLCDKPTIANGNVSLSGQFITVTCHENYFLAGAERLMCLTRNHRWSRPIPECRPKGRCDPPLPIFNGKMSISREPPYLAGTVVSFVCNEGYKLVGPLRMTCERYSFSWSESIQPFCQETGMEAMANKLTNDIEEWSLYSKSNETNPNTGARLSLHQPEGIDLVFVLDGSSSVTPSKFALGISFVSTITKEIMSSQTTGNVRVAAITYADSPTVNFDFNTSSSWTLPTMIKRLKALRPSEGGTNCGQALKKARNVIKLDGKKAPNFNEKAKRVVFLLTDGQDNGGGAITCVDSANALRRPTLITEVNVIGIGAAGNEEKLRQVADNPYQEHLFLLNDHSDLQKLKDLIIDKRKEHHKCGVAGNIDAKANYESQPNAWPWMAKMDVIHQDGSRTFCGATLICRKWAITSAQCVTGKSGNQVRKDRMTVNVATGTTDEKDVPVLNIFRHPNYTAANKHKNDIALLELRNKEITLGKSIQVVCVPKTDGTLVGSRLLWRPLTDVYLTGLGISEADLSHRDFAVPHQANFTIQEHRICRDTLELINHEDEESKLACVGSGEKASITKECLGDIGGPVVSSHALGSETFYNLVGIPTFNSQCQLFQRYTVMTKTLDYLPWIEEVTGNCNRRYNCRDSKDGECRGVLNEE